MIEVLGTSFNVKVNSEETEVGVAVADGQVSLRHNEAADGQAVRLEKGQYGSLNTTTGEFYTDDYGVDNYLAWKSGRLVFKEMRMERVCRQLGRLYEISCTYSDPAIKNRKLTTDISSESLKKTLSVIEVSLDITYEKKNCAIHWINSKANS